MPLGDNDHTHVCAHLPSLHESAPQNKNLKCAAAILCSMGHAECVMVMVVLIEKSKICAGN